jgi:general secretion pathway protein B
MSYILDALRRAEADRERERGRVPGLHTPPLPGSEAAPAAGQRRWLPWAGGGLLLVVGIGTGLWWAGSPRETAPAPAAVTPTPAPVMPDTARAPHDAAPAAPTLPAPAAQDAPQATMAPAPQPAASPYLPPPPATTTPAAPPAVPAAQAAVPARATAPVPAASAGATSAEAPLPRLAELPESLRREIPKLVISGSVYSDDPASRFLIVNGEVQHEGAKLGAELVLEQIRPHELVLRFRGQRYRQPI